MVQLDVPTRKEGDDLLGPAAALAPTGGGDDVSAAIADPAVRARALRWLARTSFLSVAAQTCFVTTVPGVLNSQQTGDAGEPSGRSATLLGALGATVPSRR